MMFRYRAITSKDGRTQTGRMAASNVSDLEQRLGQMGLLLISATEVKQRKGGTSWVKPVKRRELITFCFYLEQLIGAGVPLLEGLSDLRDSAENPKFREILAVVIQDIEGGKGLSDSLEAHPEVFDIVFVNLVRAGEESGALPVVMKQLTDNLKWQDEIAAQTKKAVMYPAFVGAVILAVVIFLMVYLVPQLVSFITSMQAELPLQTRMLVAISDFFVHDWWVLPLIPLFFYALYRLMKKLDSRTDYRMDKLKLLIPPIGPVYRKIVLARFTTVFALMFGAGISILDSLRVCEGVVGNLVIANALKQIQQDISEGQTITESFTQTELFPPLVLRMLKVGEQTGAVDAALTNVSYFYDRDVKDAIEKMQAMIEPSLTVILGLLLALIMSALMGPVYDMITKLS